MPYPRYRETGVAMGEEKWSLEVPQCLEIGGQVDEILLRGCNSSSTRDDGFWKRGQDLMDDTLKGMSKTSRPFDFWKHVALAYKKIQKGENCREFATRNNCIRAIKTAPIGNWAARTPGPKRRVKEIFTTGEPEIMFSCQDLCNLLSGNT